MIAPDPLNIALSDCLAYPRLSVPMAEHRRRHPDHPIRLHEERLVDLHRGLLAGAFEAGLCQSPAAQEGIDVRPVWRDTLALAVSAHHPLLAFSSVSLEQAADHPWIALDGRDCVGYCEQIDSLLTAAGVVPSAVTTATSFGLMMTLVAAGYGVCLAPVARIEGHRPLGVFQRPLQEGALTLTTYFLSRRNTDSTRLEPFFQALQANA
ncbi:LysR family substrate-binding domain-containing protein [Bordetella hinzii]|uniref:LysR family substrate-binding domain-containing protein n=1 Tax=Bordetella hinzii TaxID=103855 RepID=UPI0039FCF4FE